MRYLIGPLAALALIVLALAMARAMERYDAQRCAMEDDE